MNPSRARCRLRDQCSVEVSSDAKQKTTFIFMAKPQDLKHKEELVKVVKR